MAVSVGGPDFIRIEPSDPYTKFNKGVLDTHPTTTSTSEIMPASQIENFRNERVAKNWSWKFDFDGKGYHYVFESGKTTTISCWFNLRKFQGKLTDPYGPAMGLIVMKKKTSILRLRIGNDSIIEFGALAPFYLNTLDGRDKPYKGVFSPYSMGCGIKIGKIGGGAIAIASTVGGNRKASMSCTLNTDYKFNLNTWYLLSFEISNFSTGVMTLKVFVNDNLELTTFVKWFSTWGKNRVSGRTEYLASSKRVIHNRRIDNEIIAMPGFKAANQDVLPNATSWTHVFSHKLPYPDILDDLLAPNNYISNISTAPSHWGWDGKLFKSESVEINANSYIEYGTIYIYNTPYNIAHFNNTKLKYLSI